MHMSNLHMYTEHFYIKTGGFKQSRYIITTRHKLVHVYLCVYINTCMLVTWFTISTRVINYHLTSTDFGLLHVCVQQVRHVILIVTCVMTHNLTFTRDTLFFKRVCILQVRRVDAGIKAQVEFHKSHFCSHFCIFNDDAN